MFSFGVERRGKMESAGMKTIFLIKKQSQNHVLDTCNATVHLSTNGPKKSLFIVRLINDCDLIDWKKLEYNFLHLEITLHS